MVAESHGTFVFAPPECRTGDLINLPEEEAHHLRKVRRQAEGSEVLATDGAGMVYRCIFSGQGALKIKEELPQYGESKLRLTAIIGILKGDDNRDVVDDATQLGVRRIIFFRAARSEGRLTAQKLARLERTAVSSMKQCGRARLPEIIAAESFKKAIDLAHDIETLYVAQQYGEAPEKNLNATDGSAAVVVGPEGGLEESELQLLKERSAILLKLGPRRLRTRLAVNAALCRLLG